MGAGEYITKEEAASLLGVTPRQVHRYSDNGLLTKFANSSGHVRYCRRQVEAFRRRRDQFVPVKEAC
jgi:DNA-binding transcriptional MerR regulator